MKALDLGQISPDDIRQIDIVKIFSNKKCLVVDDFPEIRGSLKRSLRGFGAEHVDTAADGTEAVKLCTANKYDIVICDYNLGTSKDGQQVLEEVRFLRVLMMTSLFVLLTGEQSREMVLGALECQPDDYITKPYTEQSLKTRLNRAIIRHEALIHIKQAIADGNHRKALELCDDMIASGSRYAKECIKMKGQLLFLLNELQESKALYQNILNQKPMVWAKLGLGKTLIELAEYDTAEDLMEEVLQEDERYIEAHDMLSEIHSRKNDMHSAQKAMERATYISPKSVLRHRELAELADINHDDDVSLKSHQNSIKWGFNSCHESPQDYFNFVRKVADVTKGDISNESKQLIKQASTFLDRARKRYGNTPEIESQSLMVESQLQISLGDENKAQETVAKATKLYNSIRLPSVHSSLEFARTLYAMGDEEQARAILTSLAANNPNDKKLLRVMDGITGEPISDEGKGQAAKLTKNGINAYEEKDFDAAIIVFNQALTAYPKHIGLNLNLVQAVAAYGEEKGPNHDHEKICRRCLRAIGNLKSDHKQFKRYAFIQKQLSKIYPNLLSTI
ncbi:MAG: response regulator [Marinagarivorans sp.]|nr:response regulator [Marinagarivorans sp.]